MNEPRDVVDVMNDIVNGNPPEIKIDWSSDVVFQKLEEISKLMDRYCSSRIFAINDDEIIREEWSIDGGPNRP